MSGIFRRSFRLPPPVQSPLAVLTGAAAGGGTVQPEHLASTSQAHAPAAHGRVSAPAHANAVSFHTLTLRLALSSDLLVNSSVFHAATVASGATVLPSLFANGQSFFAPVIGVAIASPAVTNSQAFFATGSARGVATPAYSNPATYHSLRLTLRLSPSAYANASAFQAPAVAQPGMVGAPLVSSAAQIFAAHVAIPSSYDVTATLNVAGWTPAIRRQGRRRAPRSWPNLPKVEAPPWRLMVVTPDVARQRARVQMAWKQRAQQLKRKRDSIRREAILNDAIDEQIARAIVRLIAEDA